MSRLRALGQRPQRRRRRVQQTRGVQRLQSPGAGLATARGPSGPTASISALTSSICLPGRSIRLCIQKSPSAAPVRSRSMTTRAMRVSSRCAQRSRPAPAGPRPARRAGSWATRCCAPDRWRRTSRRVRRGRRRVRGRESGPIARSFSPLVPRGESSTRRQRCASRSSGPVPATSTVSVSTRDSLVPRSRSG